MDSTRSEATMPAVVAVAAVRSLPAKSCVTRGRRDRVFRTLLTLAAIGALRPLGAQQLRGTVRDGTSGLPIAGAVITTLDSGGATVARTVSGERGEYRMAVPPSVQRMRVVRLGFRPVEETLPSARGEITERDVVMMRIPYTLQQVHVTAASSCPRRRDTRAALALLEQARAGLLATIVARSENPARMVRLSIERLMDGASNTIVVHRVRHDSAERTPASWAAAHTGAEFVRLGFITDSAGSRFYHGPDAEVLLDDGFASGYCFRVMDAVRSRPNQVGLGFRPASRRRGRIDIDGALWIDTVARRLVDIEFRYVGLDRRMDRYRPGGHIAFREMANGVVLIDRWFLRGVGVRDDSVADARPRAGAPVASSQLHPVQVLYASETGGELARATWPDGYTWRASLGTLRLTIVTDHGAPVMGTTVRLDDTDYEATADSAGHLEITELAPGPYSALIADPRLDAIGVTLATSLRFVAARDSTVERRLVARTAEQYVADRCRQAHQNPDLGVWVIGRVTGPGGAPLDGVRVSAYEGERQLLANGETGSDGIFVLCNAPPRARVTFEFTRKGMQNGVATRAATEQLTVMAVQMTPDP